MNVGTLRLHNQQIANTRLHMPQQVVAWLGGMQAQDYPGAREDHDRDQRHVSPP